MQMEFQAVDSDTEEAPQSNSITVWSVSKKDTAFVGRKITIPFDVTTKNKTRRPVKCLIDSGACANVIPFDMVRRLGYGERDLLKNVGEPKTLCGYDGNCTNTLGGIKLRIKLGNSEREIPFVVVPDGRSGTILGIPGLDVFDFKIRPRTRTISF